MKLLFASENPEVLANVACVLSFLLPLVDINTENMKVWERLVQMLAHPHLSVKRSSLSAIKHVIAGNEVQTQFTVECGLVGQLSDLLINSNQDVRIEACSVLTSLGRKGYAWVILRHNTAIEYPGL